MSPGHFDGTARVASGTAPTAAVLPYRVSVVRGRLRLATAAKLGTVLDVPLDRVGTRALGRAGAVVVEVEGSPILVDFTRRGHGSPEGATAAVRRIGPALRGRWIRRRFMSAAGETDR